MAVLSTHEKRKVRIRNRLKRENKAKKPFLTVLRSNQHISAQLIDAATGHVLVSASTQEKDVREKLARGANKEAAKTIGQLVAERCQQKKIAEVVFDRSGYLYHGRVAALADAARAGGLKF